MSDAPETPPRLSSAIAVHPWGKEQEGREEVVKADHQKADDARVPRELWARFLRRTFLEKFDR